MKKTRMIGALDYAVVEFLCALNHLFRFAINSMELGIAGGLDIKAEVCAANQMRVKIRPASWPESSQISVRFQKDYREGEGSWKAFEGAMVARHLPDRFSEFFFDCGWDSNGYYRFGGKSVESERLLEYLHTARAATELNLKHLLD